MNFAVSAARDQAAKRLGLAYYWQIDFWNGTGLVQFDEHGVEQILLAGSNKDLLLKKASTDPYPNSVVIYGVKSAAWIPTDGDQIHCIDLAPTEGLVLYRKNYLPTSQPKYTAYCLGRRRNRSDGSVVEEVTWLCPATQDWVEHTDDPRFRNAYERGLAEVSA